MLSNCEDAHNRRRHARWSQQPETLEMLPASETKHANIFTAMAEALVIAINSPTIKDWNDLSCQLFILETQKANNVEHKPLTIFQQMAYNKSKSKV